MNRLPAYIVRTCLATLLAIGACDDAPSPSAGVQKVSVVASVYPLADLARNIGGSLAEVHWVVESGQSVSGVSAAEVRNRLRSADLILTGGATEPWATLGTDDPLRQSLLLRLDTLPSTRQTLPSGFLWLDPVVMQEAASELSSRFCVLRPNYERVIRERAEQYASAIDAVYKAHQFKFMDAQSRKLMVLNEDFSPFLRRFGLLPILSLQVAPTHITQQEISILKDIGEQNNTRLLVIPADTPAAAVRDLAARSGLQLILLDALGSSAEGGRSTYLDLLKYNLDQLSKAMIVQ
jgi:zinc transport system substrate-binding protein